MGCTQSKIENEEAVARCKDRKLFMKDAVAARNAFAAAHSAYAMSLKNTGAALNDYAQGEVQSSHHHHHHASASSLPSSAAAAQPPLDPLLPPPPPPSLPPSMTPIQRAASMPEMKMPKPWEPANGVGPTIVEETDGDEEEDEKSNEKLIRKRSSGRKKSTDHQPTASPARTPPPMVENSWSVQAVQDWDFWFPEDSIPGPSLEVKEEKVNVVDENKRFEEIPSKREEEKIVEEKQKEVAAPSPPMDEEGKVVEAAATGGGSVGRSMKRGKSGMGAGAVTVGEKRVAKGGLNMLQVFVELDDHFLKAYESAHEVSKMLEATRLHYHSNFADERRNSLVYIEF